MFGIWDHSAPIPVYVIQGATPLYYAPAPTLVASYAAALPQPAGSYLKQYSNNVDATLASGLEARSYQPGLNSYKESATLVSLKRRDDSEGSSGENSGSDSFLPSTSGP
ncbi:hypothetical protein BASA60_009757 [Batrachochytrium salamandrivorans]|nr:hypothetical protein BASA60_009757 [Batrachochytrium salamandrivorans]